MNVLEIRDLHVSAGGKQILKGLTLTIKQGEVHALMGPNGSGKSTLSYVIAGHPGYEVTKGDVLFDGKSILAMPPDERAKLGLFLAFQNPVEIPGVNLGTFLFTLFKNKYPKGSAATYQKELHALLKQLNLGSAFIERPLNAGLSGGEKKRAEVLQLLLTRPALAVLDETDSGLDIDSLKIVSDAVNSMRSPLFSALIITHYNRILEFLKPDFVHVLLDGKIAMTGNANLPQELEKKGYRWLKEAA
ncbi:MAG TPA: Fe-S cluster assembly ATPase SufC [Candidatus Binatia bacterium]|nr:Fe-S cluster assembly ATPase SufC [Candidatus Binatia bacterium]